jgi:hypothetical protein
MTHVGVTNFDQFWGFKGNLWKSSMKPWFFNDIFTCCSHGNLATPQPAAARRSRIGQLQTAGWPQGQQAGDDKNMS